MTIEPSSTAAWSIWGFGDFERRSEATSAGGPPWPPVAGETAELPGDPFAAGPLTAISNVP